VLRNQVIRLNPIVTGWEPVLRRIIGEDCLVRLQLSEEIGSIRADPGQLEQVLLNLALNARDAMSGGGTLTIETFRTDITSATSRRAFRHRNAAGQLFRARGVGHRARHVGPDVGPRVRAILPPPSRWAREAGSAVHGVRDRETVRRLCLGLQ
jgi:two-component system cell cycle sensor histidine kinase/response regulator CckA